MTNMGFIRFCEEKRYEFCSHKGGRPVCIGRNAAGGIQLRRRAVGACDLLDFGTTGDGQLTAAQLISILKRRQAKLSSLATLMERYPQVMVNVRVSPEGSFGFIPTPTLRPPRNKPRLCWQDRTDRRAGFRYGAFDPGHGRGRAGRNHQPAGKRVKG